MNKFFQTPSKEVIVEAEVALDIGRLFKKFRKQEVGYDRTAWAFVGNLGGQRVWIESIDDYETGEEASQFANSAIDKFIDQIKPDDTDQPGG